MKRVALAILILLACSGCESLGKLFQNTHKKEAYQRWDQARAHVLYGVGAEQFKVGDLDKAESYARQARDLDKCHLPARLLLAKVFLERGLYQEAAEELKNAETLAPDLPEAVYLSGVAQEKLGNLDEALKCYQKVRVLEPSNDAYVAASAEVLVKLGKPRQALELLDSRLANSSGNAMLLLLAGEVATVLDEPATAAEHFQRCQDIDPADLSIRERLAKALYFAGRYSQAVQALSVLAENPRYREKASWVYVMTGDALRALDRPAQAKSAYEMASLIDPEDAYAWVGLAKAALEVRDCPRAILASRQALRLAGDSVEAAILLGYALLREGQVSEAVATLKAAAQQHPADPAVWCTLGRCYAAQGQPDEAATCYRRALEHNPRDRLARALLDLSASGKDVR